MAAKKNPNEDLIWAYLLHLGYNMWSDRNAVDWKLEHVSARPYLRCETDLWNDLLKRMAGAGVTMVVIDLGEGVKYESHPELAVRRSWTTDRLRRELGRIRKMGMEPIPKLNFSACHDAWLGPYARCVSTDAYYAVCKDLIAEVTDLFDRPRFFHLGMDEETAQHQRFYDHVVIRQYDLWWRDLYYLVDQVERKGVRAWVWSDYVWHHPEAFFKKMPKSVLQSNWYYGAEFSRKVTGARAYIDLEAHGYDQVPTGSNWSVATNFPDTVTFCRKQVAPARLKGFMQTVWKPTLKVCRDRHVQAVDLMARARASWKPRR